MSNDISKAGFVGVFRFEGGNAVTKAGVAVVMRPQERNEVTKADMVVVMRPPSGVTIALDPGSYVLAGSDASLRVGRRLKMYNQLVINGDFPVNTDSWNIDGSDTTFSSVNGVGVLELGPSAAGGYTWQAVTVQPGRPYTLTALLKPKNAYTLTASPGSYHLTGTNADISVESASGVVFAGDSCVGTRNAVWTLSFNGYIYKQTDSGFAAQSGPWIVPQVGMSDYEVRATLLDGFGGGTLDTWLDLGAGQSWGFTNRDTDREGTLLIEIRRKSDHVVVASGNVTIFATGTL